jgi:SAM-dependent methyltransferase
MICPVCGGADFKQIPILWPSLIEGWGLTPTETIIIERQQGVHCMGCGCNLRAMALGEALVKVLGEGDEVRANQWLARPSLPWYHTAILEVNEAGALAPILAKIPGHVRGSWPEVDLRALPYPDERFDVVIHSDTLEHVGLDAGASGFQQALRECRRVLKPGGALCFTVPILHGKLSRSTIGRPPTYHGPDGDESLRVHTEFGADVWAYVLAAGFKRCEFTCIEWPAGLAITAWK